MLPFHHEGHLDFLNQKQHRLRPSRRQIDCRGFERPSLFFTNVPNIFLIHRQSIYQDRSFLRHD